MSNSRSKSEPHDGGARGEYLLYKAECKNICYDEVRSFYGLGSSNTKITTTDNFVTAERLQEKYPSTDLSVINMVLEDYFTWTTCCDILNSFGCTHSPAFNIESHVWPSMPSTEEPTLKRDMKNQSTESPMENPMELEVQGFEDLHIVTPPEIENGEVDLQDWEMIENEPESPDTVYIKEYEIIRPAIKNIPKNIPKGIFANIPHNISKNVPKDICEKYVNVRTTNINKFTGTRSNNTYCDVVKIPIVKMMKESTILMNGKRNIAQLTKWKPTYEVVKINRNRIDRHYGVQSQLVLTKDYYHEQDEEIESVIYCEMEMFVRASS